jgi:hypothetical protein
VRALETRALFSKLSCGQGGMLGIIQFNPFYCFFIQYMNTHKNPNNMEIHALLFLCTQK